MKTLRTTPMIMGLLCSAAMAGLTGCGEAIEDNPLFREQQKVVARLDDDTKAIARHLDEISMTLETINQQVREVRSSPQNAVNGVEQMDTRLKVIEAQMADLQDAVKGKIMNLARMELDMDKKIPADIAASADKAEPARTTQGRVTKSSAATDAPAKPAGVYHKVKEGETAEQIAVRNKISVNDLLAANRIPAGGRLFPGQSIYVPGASN